MRLNRFLKSNNPVMNEKAFRQSSQTVLDSDMVSSWSQSNPMTAAGAVNKSFILMGLMLLTAGLSYVFPSALFLWGGAIGGLVIVLIATFKRELSPTLAPLYALIEGLFVGTVTAIYGSLFDGIVFNAITLTIGLLFMMLFIYKMGWVQVNQKFRTGVIMATGAVAMVYLLNLVLYAFGMQVPYLHQGGLIGIGISVVIIVIACLNLLLDFDNFEKGEQFGAPKYMEWFCAMGLLITLVWLYIEILRLLSILSSRD